VSRAAPPCSDDLTNGVGMGGLALDLDGEDTEEEDLYGGCLESVRGVGGMGGRGSEREGDWMCVFATLTHEASTGMASLSILLSLPPSLPPSLPRSLPHHVPPAPYQKGPATPYSQATLLLCKRVAAQVHCEQTTAAIKPVLTVRPAVLKCSLDCLVPL